MCISSFNKRTTKRAHTNIPRRKEKANNSLLLLQLSVNIKRKFENSPSICAWRQNISIPMAPLPIPHEGITYPCGKCDYRSTTKGHLKTHQQSIHDKIKYPCGSCDYKASEKRSLLQHQESVHNGRKYDCTLCSLQFNHRQSLRTHCKTAHK